MKLKTLKIKNIASIEEAVIPFDEAPLASEPLFLITGDTGSGKSTILNCICLALYHTTPNLETYGSSSEKTFDDLGTNNPIQMMRRGADSAMVELTFEANNGNVYISTWGIRKRKKRGEAQKYEPTIRLECILTADPSGQLETTLTKATEIKKRIPELVGFNLDQFTRTTLLAQGQFSKFLYAKPAEKTAILEKLTGTELFAQIGMEIFRLSKDADQEFKVLEAKIKNIVLLTDDEKKQLAQQIVDASQERESVETKITEVSQQADWLSHKEIKEQNLTNKKNDLEKVEKVVSSDEFAQQKTTLEQWDFTHEVRNAMVAAQTQYQQYQSFRSQIMGLQQNYNSLLQGLRFLEDALQKKTQEQTSLQTIIEHQRPNEDMYNAAGEISRLSSNILQLREEAKDLQGKIELQRSAIQTAQQKENLLKEAAQKAEEALDKQERITKAQREQCEGLDSQALSSAYHQLLDLEGKLKQAGKDIEDYRQKLADLRQSEQTLSAIKGQIDIYNQQLTQAQEELPTLEKIYKLAKAQFEGSLRLEEHINQIREYYSAHDECPLCGTKGVTLHSKEQLEQSKLQAQQAEQIAKEKLDKAEDSIKTLKATLNVKTQDAKAKEKDYIAKKNLFELAKKNLEIEAQTLSFDYEDMEAITKLSDRLTRTAEEKAQKKAEFDRAYLLQKKAEEESKRLEAAFKAKEKAQKDLQKQQDKTKELLNDIEIKRNGLEQALQHAQAMFNNAQALIRLPEGIETLTYELLPSLSERISKDAQHYKEYQKQSETLARTIENLTSEIEISKRNLQPLSTKYETPTEVYPRQIKDLSGSITQLNSQFNTLEGKKSQALEQYRQHKDEVEGWLQQNPQYTAEALNQLQRITPTNAQSLRQYLTNTQNLLSAAREAYKTVEADLTRWLEARPQIHEELVEEILRANGIEIVTETVNKSEAEGIEATNEEPSNEDATNEDATNQETTDEATTSNTNPTSFINLLSKEALLQAAEQYQKHLNDLLKLVAQIEARLRQDKEEAARVAKDMEELARVEKIRNDWQTLASRFGGSDGKLFRDIAQSYVLRLLLQQANYYLNKLSTRYELSCEDGSLTINIIDKFQSGSIRNVTSLSGGESFVVSLALALGLSAINPQKINVDILFIDEGFGTLDKEFLDTVITSLDQLHMINGRRIGLISHVDTLKERIQTQIQVTRSGSSSSKIKIVPERAQN